MFTSRPQAMLWALSMGLMVGGGALGYLLTGSPWSWAVGGLVLAIVVGIVVRLVADGRSRGWGQPGPYDVVPGRRSPSGQRSKPAH
jgi:amino acid transporter